MALKAGDTLFLASQSVHLFSITLLDKFAHLSNFENLFQNRSILPHWLNCRDKGRVLCQEKDVSLFLDRTGEPAAQHRDSSRLKK